MEKNQKTLLNQKINVEDLEKYSKIIVKKALKVLSCSGGNAEIVGEEKKKKKKQEKKKRIKHLRPYAIGK